MIHGVVADFHLDNFQEAGGDMIAGVNERGRLALRVLERAMARVDVLHLLGDCFHHAGPSPQLVYALMRTIVSAMTFGRTTRVNIIVGNHDMMSTERGNHALGCLTMIPGVHVYDRPTTVQVGALTFFYVPFPYDVLEYKFADGPQVTCIHRGVVHEGTSEFLRESGIHHKELAKWARSHRRPADVPLVLAGDWHDHMQLPNGVAQVGTLCPSSWSDSGRNRGHMLEINDEEPLDIYYNWPRIPGPRFLFAPDAEHAVATAKKFIDKGHAPFIEYGRGDGEVPSSVVGAYFRPSVKKKKIASKEAEVATVAEKIRASSSPVELMGKYLQTRFPTRWDKIMSHISKYLESA